MPMNERAGKRGAGKAEPDEHQVEELEIELPDVRPVISVAIDDVALAALRRRADVEEHCSRCDASLAEGVVATGLFMWTRGDQVRFEEPPLCSRCANEVSIAAFLHWPYEDDFEE